jgi:alpha-galactosidase
MEMWVKELRGGKRTIALFNRGEPAMDFDPNLRAIVGFEGRHFLNLWAKNELVFDGTTALHVPSHGVLLLEQR